MEAKMQISMVQDELQQITGKPLPEAKELFSPLVKFHSVLYDAFWHSLARTREALSNTHNRKSTRMFRPQAIRFYVHDFLSQKGIKAQLVDENDDTERDEAVFKSRVLPNNGIAGNINGFPYRILNIYNGGLPPPVTKPRKIYYSQPHLEGYAPMLPGLENGKTPEIILKPNLIYLWELVNKNRSIKLYLAIPKHHLLYATTKIEFIPNPITTMKHAETEETTDIEIRHTAEV
jgi:hypothetical protein